MTRLRIRPLLWFDCAAAAVAGVAMLALSGLLAPLFGVARHWLVMTALVNVGYAGFSYSLARQAEASRRSVLALVVANFTWTGVCVALALLFAAPGSWLGAGYMLAEGLFVAGLAAAEAWAWRGKQQAANSRRSQTAGQPIAQPPPQVYHDGPAGWSGLATGFTVQPRGMRQGSAHWSRWIVPLVAGALCCGCGTDPASVKPADAAPTDVVAADTPLGNADLVPRYSGFDRLAQRSD